MSQAKVDQHKKEKVNRKKNMRKEKIERISLGLAAGAIIVAICVWIVYSVYGKATGSDPASSENSTVSVNTDAVDDYLDDLDSEN